MRKQQQKSLQTMEELMNSAQKLFGHKGFMATTIKEITNDAGYAKGSFYRHWASKDEIFLQILERKFKEYREIRDHRISQAENLEQVINIIWDFLDIITGDQEWAKVFLEFTVYAGRDEKLRARLNKGTYRLSNEIFESLVDRHIETDFSAQKMGALNTALFEGFLVHKALDTGVLSNSDMRNAALVLATYNGKKNNQNPNKSEES